MSSKKAKQDAKPAPKKVIKKPEALVVRPSNSSSKNCSKVYLSETSLASLELRSGDIVHLAKQGSISGVPGIISVQPQTNYEIETIEMSTELRKVAGIRLGDRLVVTKGVSLQYATIVECATANEDSSKKIEKVLEEIGVVIPGLEFDVDGAAVRVLNVEELPIESLSLAEKKQRRQLQTRGFNYVKQPYLYSRKSATLNLCSIASCPDSASTLPSFSSIGGLDSQISVLCKAADIPLMRPQLFADFGTAPPRGVLLHGASGTGKSLVLEALCTQYFDVAHIVRVAASSVISKYLGGAETALRDLFQEARTFEPSIILFDEIESLVPSKRPGNDDQDVNDNRILAAILQLMDGLESNCRILVIGATSQPENVDSGLRRPGRFDKEIEFPVPDAQGRFDILQKMLQRVKTRDIFEVGGDKSETSGDSQLDQIAQAAHGFVGADIAALVREAIACAIQRESSTVSFEDLKQALHEIRPSAMKGVFLEVPKVYWTDIGGQHELKRKLKEMVQLPLQAAATFARLGISAPKGVLLYGPPGCSKTLTAKALATESGLNFLAVKGPEILNKYVGESEKSIREIFRKARAAAPSIVFFDEIDAIAEARKDGSSVGSNVLTTLLNEIDGVEELNGVVLVGATNKPWSIDAALMRPGRLDRHIYVGPPDYEARLKILEMRSQKFGLEEEFLKKLANDLEGCSGAEVVLACQEAGINAVMENADAERVEERHFEGVERMKRGITKEMLDMYNDWGEK